MATTEAVEPGGASSGVAGSLGALTDALGRCRLELDLSLAPQGRTGRDELAHQIDDYLLPRLRRLDAPLLAVLGGSTGSGKSTITNTIVGADVSAAGVLRPTTRAPVLICHPSDEAWFAGGDILPDLPRVTGTSTGTATATGSVLRLTPSEAMQEGLALIDAPDIDSVEDANRDLATQLLSAADMWLFATTAVRYADAVPWEFLRQAQERGTALACIINRIPPGASAEIVPHFETMLTKAGLTGVQVFPIEQADLVEGRLPPGAVDSLRSLLVALATDAEERARVVRQTLDGAMASIPARVENIIDAVDEQATASDELRSSMERIYSTTLDAVDTDISSGALLRSEVLDRWQELIGTAELMKAVQSRISWVRDRLGAFLSGRPGSTTEVQGEITSTLEQLLIDHADKAAATTTKTWKGISGGRQVLGDDRSLETCSDDFRNGARAHIQAWQGEVLDLVRARGASKRTAARVMAIGVNTIGISLMIAIFAQTGGLTGTEVAVGAGTATVSQTLLSALFGEQAVRDLAIEARRLLTDRIDSLLNAEAERFSQRLSQADASAEAAAQLRSALADFTSAVAAS